MANTFIIPARLLESAIKSLADHAQKTTRDGSVSVIQGIRVKADDGLLELVGTDGCRLLTVSLADHQLAGTYPNFAQIVPTSFSSRMVVPGAALIASLRHLPVNKNDGSPVRLVMNGKLRIEGQDAQATIPADIVHPDGEAVMTFNRDFLVDAIRATAPAGDVMIEFNGPHQAALIHAAVEDPAAKALLMPIRQ